jgi:DNA-binding PadR family transcriptional regulator
MYDETWGDPRESRGPRERHGGHRGRGRTRGMPGPGPWGPGGPGGRGGPGGAGFEFGMRGGPFGPGRFGGRGPRVRRGDVRAAILDLLSEGQSWNGYQIIQEIGARTQNVWRPSAGSVYPALQQLEDEGLIQAEASEDRRRTFTLTEQGRTYVTDHADELKASWDAVTGSVDASEVQLRDTIRQVAVAVTQVAQAGSPAQVQQAAKILADTRRALYRILAADEEEAGEGTQG